MIDVSGWLFAPLLCLFAVNSLGPPQNRFANLAIFLAALLLLGLWSANTFFGVQLLLPIDPSARPLISRTILIVTGLAVIAIFAGTFRRIIREERERIAALED